MAKAAKIVTVLVLGGLAIGGFAFAKKKIDENKGTGGGDTPTAGSVSYAKVTDTDATIYESGTLVDTQIARDRSAAIAAVHDRMRADGVSTYFIYAQSAEGGWYATGYRDGASASDDMGPYASDQIAMEAGTKWVKAQAVPMPPSASDLEDTMPSAAVGARSTRRSTMGGGHIGGHIGGRIMAKIGPGPASAPDCWVGYDETGQAYLCCASSDTCIPLPFTWDTRPSSAPSDRRPITRADSGGRVFAGPGAR